MTPIRAFEVLEIEQTTDKKKIKKAYAKLVKQYHPEEFPEEWKRVHEAYADAIKWANEYIKTDNEIPTGQQRKIGNKKAEGPSQYDELEKTFDNLDRLVLENRNRENQENLKRALCELKKLGKSRELSYEDWKALLNNEDYAWAIGQEAFIRKLGEVLTRKRIDGNLYNAMKEQLKMVQNEIVSEQPASDKQKSLNDAIAYTDKRVESAYRRYYKKYIDQKGDPFVGMMILCLIGVVVFVCMAGITKASNNRVVHQQSSKQQVFSDWDRVLDGEQQQRILPEDEHHQYAKKGIYLLDVRDIYKETGKYVVKEIVVPDWVSDMPEAKLPVESSRAFSISSYFEGQGTLLWCNPEMLEIEGEYRIYSKVDGEYVEIMLSKETEKELSDIAASQERYEVLGYQVFAVDMPAEVIIVAVE